MRANVKALEGGWDDGSGNDGFKKFGGIWAVRTLQ